MWAYYILQKLMWMICCVYLSINQFNNYEICCKKKKRSCVGRITLNKILYQSWKQSLLKYLYIYFGLVVDLSFLHLSFYFIYLNLFGTLKILHTILEKAAAALGPIWRELLNLLSTYLKISKFSELSNLDFAV